MLSNTHKGCLRLALAGAFLAVAAHSCRNGPPVHRERTAITVCFRGAKILSESDTTAEGHVLPRPVRTVWSSNVSDSAFAAWVSSLSTCVDAEPNSCARGVHIYVAYSDSSVDTLWASIFGCCPIVEYRGKKGFESKQLSGYALGYLKGLYSQIPTRPDWELTSQP